MPRLVPADAQDPGGPADVAFFQHVDRQPLKQQREARVGLGPRQAHLPHAMVRASDPRGPRVQGGHELTGVEVAPRPFGRVVVDGQLFPTRRTGPADAGRVPGPHIHAFLRHRQVDAGHRPGRFQPQPLAVQVDIAHSSHPPREPSWRTARASWKLTGPWTHRPRPPHLGKRSAFPTSFHSALSSSNHPRKTRKSQITIVQSFTALHARRGTSPDYVWLVLTRAWPIRMYRKRSFATLPSGITVRRAPIQGARTFSPCSYLAQPLRRALGQAKRLAAPGRGRASGGSELIPQR